MSGAYGNGRAESVASHLDAQWGEDERWRGIERPYTAEEVVRLRPAVAVRTAHQVAPFGSETA